jgi:hypothetical protein
VRGGDPSIVPAFGLLLVLGRAVLVDRREGGVSGASRADDCNIDQQGLSSHGEGDVREHLPDGVGLPHKGLQLQWTVGMGLAEHKRSRMSLWRRVHDPAWDGHWMAWSGSFLKWIILLQVHRRGTSEGALVGPWPRTARTAQRKSSVRK